MMLSVLAWGLVYMVHMLFDLHMKLCHIDIYIFYISCRLVDFCLNSINSYIQLKQQSKMEIVFFLNGVDLYTFIQATLLVVWI